LKTEEREQKERIQNHICRFQTGDFMTNAESLFTTLGYASDRRVKIDKDYLCNKGLNQEKALFSDWREAGLLYQVTGEDLSNQGFLFEIKFDIDRMQSYLFYAIELEPKIYQRGKLAQITREVNKLFPMPVFILFKYGNRLTFSIIDRRQHKCDESKDVLEKVTLIKDISIINPHRAHIEILYDLSYPELLTNFRFSNFEGLHKAWQKTLDTKELNKKFYRELSAWYFYAKQNVLFPDDVEKDADKRNSINLIRLITRLIFVWFVKEKGLVPEELFDEDFLRGILNYSDKTGSTYYKAILQNLFFATLNLEMNKDKPDSRKFVEREDGFHSDQHLQAAYRYVRFFKEPDKALTLFENIPFLNGGLFENLDFEITKDGKREIRRIDCFSDHPQNETRLKVPDELFFSDLQKVDLSAVYEDNKKRSEEFRGIINIFKRYKFTIEENTPIEEEIALDPELLGKVFENLLASYNPETHTTARKATGSFYTPREIVNYMVDESLVAYLETQLKEQVPEFKEMETLGELLRDTLSYTEKEHPFTKAEEIDALINAIDNCKILDPACGSGAFPMGILHKLVYLLHKLDPQNEKWMQRQIERVQSAIREAEKVEDTAIRDHLLHDLETNIESIEDAFLNNELDYGRKLYLIENCIYGVDIQPIAIQIAKLRFFISLVIDQKVDPAKPNLNIRALPNLETKFVAANTLIGLEKPAQITLRNPRIDRLEIELKEVRKKHFNARTRREKKQLRAKDEELRNKIAELLIGDRWSDKSARQLADWNPYDQNTSSPFFDPEWMFGIANGFDIVIGNPPYGVYQGYRFGEIEIIISIPLYDIAKGGKLNAYKLFLVKSIDLVKPNGLLCEIFQNSFLADNSAKLLRHYFLDSHRIISLDSFPERDDIHKRVFECVKMSVCIMLCRKERKPSYDFIVSIWSDKYMTSSKTITYSNQDILLLDPENNTILLSSENEIYILRSLAKNARLSGVAYCYEGEINLTFHRKYLRQTSHGFSPMIKGAAVQKYLIKERMSQGITEWIDSNKYLKENTSKKSLHHRQRRIVMQGITGVDEKIRLKMTIIDAGVFCGNSCNYILINDKDLALEFLLGLLNSSLLNWYFKSLSTNSNVNGYEVNNFPLPLIPNKKWQAPIITLVNRILAAKRENPQADTTALERDIDRLVYELYGLTEEEIAVVEGKNV
jgi:hypothetical protein